MQATILHPTASGLLEARKNVYSQFGEDGLLEAIFKKIGTRNRRFFEAGASDGVFCSNTRALAEDGWCGLWVERDNALYGQLVAGLNGLSSRVRAVKADIMAPGGIDGLLGGDNAPEDIDLCVIDIDSHDYWAWLRMAKFRPRVVVIEHNIADAEFMPTAKPGSPAETQAGLKVLERLAWAKLYLPIVATECNLICVLQREWMGAAIEEARDAAVRLNLGGGKIPIAGYVSLDRADGKEAYPLTEYADGSVDEIRASHLLEHFPMAEVPKVLAEWSRALKVGGVMRIAVPDVEWIMAHRSDPLWPKYLMGGQTDESDYHKAVFNRNQLAALMAKVGIENVKPWKSDIPDCASLPVSLNLEGIKGDPVLSQQEVKIAALMSIPRYGSNAAWGCVHEALYPFKIPVHRFSGAFWGQCMQRGFNELLAGNVDWILTIDHDSMFTAANVDRLMGQLAANPKIDAIVALQPKRGGSGFMLGGIIGQKEVEVDPTAPFEVDSAHFGLTIIRAEALRKVAKPWFAAKHNEDGEWSDGRVDEDIWFWKQWKAAGNTIFVDPGCSIGHAEEMVSIIDTKDGTYKAMSLTEWRNVNGYKSE